MSAVGEYRKARCNDLNEDPAFEQGRSFLRDYADDAIAELEAALAEKRDFYETIDLSTFNHAVRRAEQAEAERDALRDGVGILRRRVLAVLPTYSPTTRALINNVFDGWQPR